MLSDESDRLMTAAMEDGLRVAFGPMRAIPADGVTGEEQAAELAVFHETTQQVWAGMVERHGNYALVGALYGLARLGALIADMVASYGTVTREGILNDIEFGVIALTTQRPPTTNDGKPRAEAGAS